MSYDDYDVSTDSSQPDELFDFLYEGDDTHYRVTSSAFPITFEGFVYTPLAGIKRDRIQSSVEEGRNQMKITGIERDNFYFLRHIFSTRTYGTILTIYTIQPDFSYIVAWSGKLVNVSRPKNKGISIIASPVSVLAKKPVSCALYQIQCANKLFDRRCGIESNAFTEIGVINSINGNEITADVFVTQTDGWFTGGEFKVNGEGKTIVYHVGNTIRLLDIFYSGDIIVGDSFTATSGCLHDLETCVSKFNNHLNYRGTPYIPEVDNIQAGLPFTY